MSSNPDDAFVLELRIQFCHDAIALCENIEGVLLNLERNQTREYIDELKRHLHCLKGNAQVAGFSNISKVSHNMESSLSEGAITDKVNQFLATIDQMASAVREFLSTKEEAKLLNLFQEVVRTEK